MRVLVIIATILLVPAFAVIMEWTYLRQHQPGIEQQLRTMLRNEGLEGVKVTLDHFDAALSGECSDPEAREKAEQVVERLKPLRIREGENRIQVPALLKSSWAENQADNRIRITGWVDSAASRKQLLEVTKRFRPDLDPEASELRESPHVNMGAEVTVAAGSMPQSIANFLETIRVPASLSIAREKDFLRIKGFLPSAELRARVIAAVTGKPNEWFAEATRLHANEYVAATDFTKADPLTAFLKDFYSAPDAGDFSITVRGGPHLKGFATRAMVDRWLTLLLPVSGSKKVSLDQITYLPSEYHFPGYVPTSVLREGGISAEALRALLKNATILFESGSTALAPDQVVKLGPLVYPLSNSGAGLRVVVAGFADVGGEPNATKGVINLLRATAVKKQLMRMGVPSEFLELEALDMPQPKQLTDEARAESRRVELLLK